MISLVWRRLLRGVDQAAGIVAIVAEFSVRCTAERGIPESRSTVLTGGPGKLLCKKEATSGNWLITYDGLCFASVVPSS